jgi:hypothetical protein
VSDRGSELTSSWLLGDIFLDRLGESEGAHHDSSLTDISRKFFATGRYSCWPGLQDLREIPQSSLLQYIDQPVCFNSSIENVPSNECKNLPLMTVGGDRKQEETKERRYLDLQEVQKDEERRKKFKSDISAITGTIISVDRTIY